VPWLAHLPVKVSTPSLILAASLLTAIVVSPGIAQVRNLRGAMMEAYLELCAGTTPDVMLYYCVGRHVGISEGNFLGICEYKLNKNRCEYIIIDYLDRPYNGRFDYLTKHIEFEEFLKANY